MVEVNKIRKEMFDSFRNVPEDGKIIKYLDKNFIVYPNTFFPHNDSKPLVENFVIKEGESVLDLCTGSGVIAIFSAYKGAGKVVAIDFNPNAVRSARENVKRHGFEKKVEVRQSDMFENIGDDEKFDVVTGNLPFGKGEPKDFAESNILDKDFHANTELFNNLAKHLKDKGRVYLSQANFGNVEDFKEMADKAGFSVQKIGEKDMGDGLRIFYAFELAKK